MKKYHASRSKVIGAVLRRYAEEDIERLLIEPRKR